MDIDDVHVTLKSIELNKQYECKCEGYEITCELKQKLSTNSRVFSNRDILLGVDRYERVCLQGAGDL